MYYEERLINGDWYWRGDPRHPWHLFTRTQLLNKIALLRKATTEADTTNDHHAPLSGRGEIESNNEPRQPLRNH